MKCPYCGKKPHELNEYVDPAQQENITPEEYVRREEGTFHSETQLFCCTGCYIRIGMPSNHKLHDAFRYYREQIEPLEVTQ